MFAIILFAFAFVQARGVPETVQPAAKASPYVELTPEQLTERVPRTENASARPRSTTASYNSVEDQRESG